MLRLIIGKGEIPKKIEKILSDSYKSERDIYVECKFEPGIYFAYVEADWLQNIANEIVISAYTE